MAFLDTAPRKGDSDNNLLFKIAQELSNRNGGAFPPMLGDSDNNLLYKIAQLIILGGGTAGTCAADLATCNAAAGVSAASLAACNAMVALLQAQIAANPQDMQVEWTPTSLKLGEMFGYGVGGTTNFPGITSITFKGASSLAGFTISAKADLTSLSFPNLASISANGLVASTNPVLTTVSLPTLTSSTTVTFNTNSLLTSVSAPLLSSSSLVAGSNPVLTNLSFPSLLTATTVSVTGNTLLSTLSLPALVTLGSTLGLTTDPALANLDLSSYVPTNGRQHNITGAALTDTSVNLILARGVANAAYVSGTINTSGGTSSAPTGQGILDKATLQARGVTVTTN